MTTTMEMTITVMTMTDNIRPKMKEVRFQHDQAIEDRIRFTEQCMENALVKHEKIITELRARVTILETGGNPMGIKNAIRKPALPDLEDLQGWEMRVVQLEGELKRAQMMVKHLQKKQAQAEAENPEKGLQDLSALRQEPDNPEVPNDAA